MSINFCEVGNFFRKTKKVSYLSKSTFLDYDAVILNLSSTGVFSSFEYESKEKYERRKENLKEFLEHKKIPLISFAPQINTKFIHGMGEAVMNFFIPCDQMEVSVESGENVVVVSQTPFTEFLEKYKKNLFYNSFFTLYSGTPILKAPHTQRVLAYYNNNIVFLPALKDIIDVEQEFLADLFEVLKKINASVKIDLPMWADDFLLPKENEIANDILSIQQQIKVLDESLEKSKEVFGALKAEKLIFTGTGDALEIGVRRIFQSLGFEILDTDANRDDLIIRYNNKIAVVEIKGVSGTSGEKHASQLEKWVSSYFENTGVQPKGILVVNSFKDIPLNQRREATFPNQMLKYSERREHCLITSLQLLGLYYKANEGGKEELINSLFESIGVYKGFENWEDYITPR